MQAAEFTYLWDWFQALTCYRPRARTPVLPSEINAWAAGMGITIEPYEFEVLTRMDITYLSALPPPKGR